MISFDLRQKEAQYFWADVHNRWMFSSFKADPKYPANWIVHPDVDIFDKIAPPINAAIRFIEDIKLAVTNE